MERNKQKSFVGGQDTQGVDIRPVMLCSAESIFEVLGFPRSVFVQCRKGVNHREVWSRGCDGVGGTFWVSVGGIYSKVKIC